MVQAHHRSIHSMYQSKAYSAASERASLTITSIPRREATDRDVQIAVQGTRYSETLERTTRG